MTEAHALLAELRRRGFTLTVEADGTMLGIVPKSALDDDLRARIRAHKADLLASLTGAAVQGGEISKRSERSPAPLPLERLVLHMAAELGWPKVMTISGQYLGPGEADWRRVLESPALLEPIKGLLLAGLRGALVRRQDGVPPGESWYEHEEQRA